MSSTAKQLHWTQRVALVRHNLHAACRSGDFTFFKALQATGLMEGTNHCATLTEELGDDADTLFAAIDNLNASLAYVYQDAFKSCYDSVKAAVSSDDDEQKKEARSKLYVDISMQRNQADSAIEKIASSAVGLINQQPQQAQDAAANVWVTGFTLVTDAVEISLQQMNLLESKMDDFIRMEDSWTLVKASVVDAVTIVKGVFQLMDPTVCESRISTRNSSIASASAGMFRRLSCALTQSSTGGSSARSGSVASVGSIPYTPSMLNKNAMHANSAPVYRTPIYVRSSVVKGHPTGLPMCPPTSTPATAVPNWLQHKLSVVPPTPSYDEDSADPFDTGNLTEVLPAPEMPLPPLSPLSPVSPISPAAMPVPALAPETAGGLFDGRRSSMAVM